MSGNEQKPSLWDLPEESWSGAIRKPEVISAFALAGTLALSVGGAVAYDALHESREHSRVVSVVDRTVADGAGMLRGFEGGVFSGAQVEDSLNPDGTITRTYRDPQPKGDGERVFTLTTVVSPRKSTIDTTRIISLGTTAYEYGGDDTLTLVDSLTFKASSNHEWTVYRTHQTDAGAYDCREYTTDASDTVGGIRQLDAPAALSAGRDFAAALQDTKLSAPVIDKAAN